MCLAGLLVLDSGSVWIAVWRAGSGERCVGMVERVWTKTVCRRRGLGRGLVALILWEVVVGILV